MTTITLNEKTKAGKIVLELAKIVAQSNKGISIEAVAVKDYSNEFKEKIRKAEQEIKEGKTITITTQSIWESIQ